MLYYEFMRKAVSLAVVEADNGKYYLEPAFRVILDSEGLNPADVTDYEISWTGVKEYLELYVKKMNALSDNTPIVVDWLYQIITTQVDPAMMEEENEAVKNLIEYMRLKNGKAE